jgi:hypothetical protein
MRGRASRVSAIHSDVIFVDHCPGDRMNAATRVAYLPAGQRDPFQVMRFRFPGAVAAVEFVVAGYVPEQGP